METKASTIWDVVVIGGGPAGMMAAGTAGINGKKVLLIEKNATLGKKLLITGGGRCNVTNAEPDTRKLLEKFGKDGKFLFSAFSQFDTTQALEFFNSRGMTTKVENELRVFPTSDKAQSVWNVLSDYMREGNVTIKTYTAVENFVMNKNGSIEAVRIMGDEIKAKSFILATGGKSHPETGSTGDGFGWLKDLGHNVIESNPSLVPVKLSESWVKELSGISLPMVKFSLMQNNYKQSTHKGKLLFTHFGISGPGVLNMSGEIRERLEYAPVTLVADLLPSLDHKQVDTAILESFKGEINKKFKNISSELFPNALMQTLGILADIDPETPCHSVSREARLNLVQLIKALPMRVSGLLGTEKAVITSGGIALEEIDFKTMRSRKIQNLFVTGDILNIARPTGGYSLQLCWTTGFVAGKNA
ncbi:MAG: NAD(P)/FAD-dependent oxidoreductase [Candidatus Pacebacteria bacterium]|nr:NAD(P)/FAD-dependent oxidoreductase [Candidatus Paceibacterota bacterium]